MLERAQASPGDLLVYRLIEAHLHSLSSGDPDTAANAVDSIMQSCVNFAAEHDPRLIPRILNNWALHLAEVYQPAIRTPALQEAERKWGPSQPGALFFPHPMPWVT
ncbi:hypothetical protein [Nocardia camponoti]|uniref:Uncharacterized protein n=1 Tax=Nocardia camponoti TaxID=1616106 RepID=A0A917Q7S9_9NOCA|nr:hypothetical protein [Nocardia camponoti]GGK33933.1 hypothetical protein GCM10011591_02000 [Nocardia camponoti]